MNNWRPTRIKSFYYAFSGIRFNLRHEPNFRFQFVFGMLVIIAGIFFPLSRVEWLIILLTIAAVWSAELFNTAIEKICDRFLEREDHLVKIVKDSSAAGVLITSIIAVIIGMIIFIPYLIDLIGRIEK